MKRDLLATHDHWLACNPLTAARVVSMDGIYGLYCGDSGYFLVEPSTALPFLTSRLSVRTARAWAKKQGTRAAARFSEHWLALEPLLRLHDIDLEEGE